MSLYSEPRRRTTTAKDPITASSTNFTSSLSSLIASAHTTTTPASSRKRPAPPQSLAMAPPKRTSSPATNAKKRKHSAVPSELVAKSKLSRADASHELDDEAWSRAKRGMDEKARLYAALKRGDVEDAEDKYGVDFDRKWAERKGDKLSDQSSSSSWDDDADDTDERDVLGGGKKQLVEYTDEYGRTRTGTAKDAAREKRRRAAASLPADEFTARPAQPASVIHGDTVQAAAFNPDDGTVAQMEELAAKRDREATPPEAARYDARSEVRSKGTGFFAFSADEAERVRQMEGLERERAETERARGERVRSAEERRRRRVEEVEKRRRIIGEKKGRAQADRFLEDLGKEIAGGGGGSAEEQGR